MKRPVKKQRFPDNLISAVRQNLDATPELSLDFGKAAWRQHGERRAYAWILTLYGEPVDKGLVGDIPGGRLDWSERKPTKEDFAILVDETHEYIQIANGFDPSSGYIQVEKKSNDKNQAYGFWDTLNTLADEFELWAVAHKGRGRRRAELELEPSEIYLRKTTRLQDGECNFCPSRDAVVYEIGSSSRTLKVRVCTRCLHNVINQAKVLA